MPSLTELKKKLTECVALQAETVARWHAQPAPAEGAFDAAGQDGLDALEQEILAEHLVNFLLWHVEDEARRTDVNDASIADCKRRIDGLNQRRNNAMERVDERLVSILAPLMPATASASGTGARINTESPGTALDRLSILALKVFHMQEQTLRTDVGPEHIQGCRDKLGVLCAQREDLEQALLELMDDYVAGTKRPQAFRQCKMYNDPTLNPAVYGAAGQGGDENV